MDSSLDKKVQINKDAIKNALSKRKINAHDIREFALSRISEELSQRVEEVNMDSVDAYLELLENLTSEKVATYESHFDSNLLCIRRKLKSKQRTIFSKGIRIALAMCVLFLCIFGEILIPHSEFSVTHSFDKEQLIIQGSENDESTVSHAMTTSKPKKLGSFDTANWNEAIQIYGFVPNTPKWLPEEFHVIHYSIDILEAYRTIIVLYGTESGDKTMLFTERRFHDVNLARREIEQNSIGEIIVLENGISVYVAKNYDALVASWFGECTQSTLYGDLTKDELLLCITSITQNKES